MSASGITTRWFFAPPSACTRLPAAVPVRCTYSAIGVEPTKLTAATSSWVSSASTASLSPLTTFSTPGGTPASTASSASRRPQDGSFSDGFSTKVLPQASAIGYIHIGTIAGKLNGVIPAQTPRGWRTLKLSTPPATFSLSSPLRSCGIPQANSTISMPRVTDPLASSRVLPCSDEQMRASSSRWASTRSR